MNIDELRAGVEEQMLAQADSVGELLEQFKSRFPPVLIGGRGWNRLVERAGGLPISLATAGFGFELRLHEAEPRADLGLALFHGSLSAAHFEEWSRSRPEDASARAVVGLLQEMGREGDALHDAKLLLEYDIDPAHPGPFPDPGIFLYPTSDALPGPGSAWEPEKLCLIADRVAAACGWGPGGVERRHAEELFRAPRPGGGTQVGSLGAFPDRTRALRVGITGIRSTAELTSILEHAGWPGRVETFASFVGDLEARGAFAHMAAHLDIGPDGVRPELGVSYYTGDTRWVMGTEPWMGIVDGLRAPGLVVPEKLSALTESWAGVETVFGRCGLLLVVRGIHHFKTTLVDERVKEVKAYVFCLVLPPLAATDAPTAK